MEMWYAGDFRFRGVKGLMCCFVFKEWGKNKGGGEGRGGGKKELV